MCPGAPCQCSWCCAAVSVWMFVFLLSVLKEDSQQQASPTEPQPHEGRRGDQEEVLLPTRVPCGQGEMEGGQCFLSCVGTSDHSPDMHSYLGDKYMIIEQQPHLAPYRAMDRIPNTYNVPAACLQS